MKNLMRQRHVVLCAVVGFFFLGPGLTVHAHGKNADSVFTRLSNAELQKVAGSWELKVSTKEGWKGTVYLFIFAAPVPGGDASQLGPAFFDGKLSHPKEKQLRFIQSLAPRPFFVGMKKSGGSALVCNSPRRRGARTEFEPFPEYTIPFALNDNKLTLDLSRSAPFFLPQKMLAVDLDYAALTWVRSNKDGPLGGK